MTTVLLLSARSVRANIIDTTVYSSLPMMEVACRKHLLSQIFTQPESTGTENCLFRLGSFLPQTIHCSKSEREGVGSLLLIHLVRASTRTQVRIIRYRISHASRHIEPAMAMAMLTSLPFHLCSKPLCQRNAVIAR